MAGLAGLGKAFLAEHAEELGDGGWAEPLRQGFVGGFRVIEVEKEVEVAAVGLDGIAGQGPLDSKPVEEIPEELPGLDGVAPGGAIRAGLRAQAGAGPGGV